MTENGQRAMLYVRANYPNACAMRHSFQHLTELGDHVWSYTILSDIDYEPELGSSLSKVIVKEPQPTEELAWISAAEWIVEDIAARQQIAPCPMCGEDENLHPNTDNTGVLVDSILCNKCGGFYEPSVSNHTDAESLKKIANIWRADSVSAMLDLHKCKSRLGELDLLISEYKKSLRDNCDTKRNLIAKFFAIGAPLNDNLLKFNEDQIKWAFSVVDLIERINTIDEPHD